MPEGEGIMPEQSKPAAASYPIASAKAGPALRRLAPDEHGAGCPRTKKVRFVHPTSFPFLSG